MGNCCFSFYLTQDLDRIAEANELFDAVLTGSVDLDKKVTPNVMPPNKTLPNDGPTTVKIPGKYSLRRLSLYIGNFPWVSIFIIILNINIII